MVSNSEFILFSALHLLLVHFVLLVTIVWMLTVESFCSSSNFSIYLMINSATSPWVDLPSSLEYSDQFSSTSFHRSLLMFDPA